MNKKNILLVGMPGTGKSTLGALLAESLNKNLIDTDILIREICGIPTQQALDELGNDAYGKYECQALEGIVEDDLVIATGGSAIYQKSAVMYLKKNAIVVHLRASFETLSERIKDFSTRAIVIKEGMTFADLYAERMPLYQAVADIELITDEENDSPHESTQKALTLIRQHADFA